MQNRLMARFKILSYGHSLWFANCSFITYYYSVLVFLNFSKINHPFVFLSERHDNSYELALYSFTWNCRGARGERNLSHTPTNGSVLVGTDYLRGVNHRICFIQLSFGYCTSDRLFLFQLYDRLFLFQLYERDGQKMKAKY